MGQREDLELLRDGLIEAFEHADYAVKAQVAGQLRAVLKDLAGLGETEDGSLADEISARREARRAGAAPGASAARRGQPRRRGGSDRTG